MTLTVTFIFRDARKKGFSIEEIFRGLIQHIKQDLIVQTYQYDQTQSFLTNVIRLRSLKSDIYHITGDVNFLALFLPPRKTVLTIHDIGHFKNLNGWKKWLYGQIWMYLPMSRVSTVTCVSEYTARDIKAHFPLVNKTIRIIPNPVPDTFKPHQLTFNERKPRILLVGTGAHKNLPTLFAAVRGISCQLAIIGPLDEHLLHLLSEYQIDFENYTNLSQAEVYEQYIKCDIVSFVTTHEGFGMPVLEAQAVGRPILTSSVCSLPEVAADTAAIVQNPMDVDAVKFQILRIIQDPDYRTQLTEAGTNNIRRFEMKKIVQAYLDIYRSLPL